jgi:O-antigen/teichoic acid export membrane protein
VAEFGTYFIAAQVATGVLQLIFPLTTAALPRVVHLRADGPALRGLNVRLLAAIVLCFAVGAVVLGAFGLQALRIWFAQADVPAIWTYVRVLLAGVACNALATVGYMNWLAHNRPGRILFANATTLIVVCTVTPILVWKFGGVGAAVGYMLAQAAATLISLDWVAAGPAFARFRKRIRGVNFGAAGSD